MGAVHRRDHGGLLSADFRLYVGQRERSKLIAGMAKQVEAVRNALGEPLLEEFALSITPVLCFVDAEWGLFARPFRWAASGSSGRRASQKRLPKPGHLAPEHVLALTKKVVAALPRA